MLEYVTEYDIVINKPIQFVYDNTTCQKGCMNWATGMRSAEKLGDGPRAVGSEYRHGYTFMGINASSTTMVTRLEPPYEFATADRTSKLLKYESEFSFKETPEGGTHIHVKHTHRAEDNMLGRVATPTFIRSYRKQFQADLETLKALLEDDIVIQAP